MSDVPEEDLRRLVARIRSQAGIFKEDSRANRLGEWCADELEDVIEEAADE